MILSFTHQITEKRNFGGTIVNQEMEVQVDYNTEDNSYFATNVFIRQHGLPEMEISKLLDKAEGDPLSAIIEAIDWQEIYNDQKHTRIESKEFNMATFANQLLSSIKP